MKKIGKIISLVICFMLVFAFGACAPNVAVESVAISETELEIKMGESATLTAQVLPENASDQNIVWTSEDSDIATVQNGVVTGVDEGIVLIRAASAANAAKYDECEVTVKLVQYTVRFMANGTAYSTQIIKRGGNARIPINEPIKDEHKFDGWFTAETGGTRVTAANNVTANADYYAQFTKVDGPVFRNFFYEAEHINLYGLVGEGASGTEPGRGMIISEADASGDENQCVSYLYKQITLTFIVWSDRDAASQLFINVGTENAPADQYDGISGGGDADEKLLINVNNKPQEYESFSVLSRNLITNAIQFVEGDLGVIDLTAGLNYITITIVPGLNPGLVIDYIRFRTTATLQWHELDDVVNPDTTPGYPNLPKS